MTEPASAGLRIETLRQVRLITLNRPKRSNALTPQLISALLHAVIDAEADPDIRVIVFTGTGDRAFCAGGDLKELGVQDKSGVPFRHVMSAPERFFLEAIMETTKPTIAAINGAAVAGGFELALACDLRIAEEHAVFGLPEAKRGMGAHFSCVMLPRVIPRAIALEMLFRGEYVDAQEMARWGFLNRVVPSGQALESALSMAHQIAGNAPVTVRRAKETVVKSSGMPTAAALRLNEGLNPYLSEDRQEGTQAFIEKREPRWKGR